jgi:hypothetical protein
MGKKINVYRILVGNAEGKYNQGRLRCRWLDNTENDI